MKLSDKIIHLRKTNGLSQEDLAEKLNVSRQAISRWENGTALPDAQNVLQISKLFQVTADYLLNDDYESDRDIPAVQTATQETEDLFSKKKRLHLFAAIGFSVCWLGSLIGAVNSITDVQLMLSVLTMAVSVCTAVFHYVRFFQKKK